MSSNLFDKNCTQQNVQLHIQHGESWIRGIEIVLAHFQRLLGRNNRDVFLENEGKIHEGGYVKEFFSLTCRLASRNFIID